MKFFALFALAAFIAVAAAYPYKNQPQIPKPNMAHMTQAAPAKPELTEIARPERSYGGAKCGKAVLVACAPIVQKVKCKGKY